MIVQVIIRNVSNGKDGETLFSEYHEIKTAGDANETALAALAQAYLSFGINHGKMRWLDLSEKEIIAAYVDKKMSTQGIAAEFGTSAETIGRYLKSKGVVMRPPGRRLERATQEQKDEVAALVRAKATRVQISERTGLSEHYVRKILSELGMALPKGRRRNT